MSQDQSQASAQHTHYNLTGTITDLRPGRKSADRLYGRFAYTTAGGLKRTAVLIVPPSYLTTIGDTIKMASGRGETRLRGFFVDLKGDRSRSKGFVAHRVLSAPPPPPAAASAPAGTGNARAFSHGREGYYRTQHYGKGRALTKVVFIAATTVRPDLPAKRA